MKKLQQYDLDLKNPKFERFFKNVSVDGILCFDKF